jgi:hypothetical protein
MAKQIHWAGAGEAQCRALHEAGHSLTVEPFDSFELDDDLADALLASTGDWQEGEGPGKPEPPSALEQMTVAQLDELAATLEIENYPARGKANKIAAIEAAQAAQAETHAEEAPE